MSKLLLIGQHRFALQICAAGAMAALVSGCSSDATRLGDPFGNPFETASAASPKTRRHLAAAGDVIPAGRTPPVTSQALAPRAVSVASLAPAKPATLATFKGAVSSETTGSIDRGLSRTAAGPSFGGWSSAGGTPIQVADGETADILAKRYGVPMNALLQTNGLHNTADVRPGTRITIPIYAAGGEGAAPVRTAETATRPVEAALKTVAAPAARLTPSKIAVATKPVRVKAAAQAPLKAGKLQHVADAAKSTTPAATAVASTLKPQTLGKLPGSAIKGTQPAGAKAQTLPVATKPVKSAAATSTTVVPQSSPPADTAATASAAPAAVADNNPEFRWPARGRIIQGFKGGSGGNDGINIAVPEGTAVKAAEGGVVAYAGSELKGYGNLVLIRHPNGFVSAYANNGEIDVKRGETVKRGQMIAKSGQSGNVSSPQLHFELRKGATPVDPTQYLAGL